MRSLVFYLYPGLVLQLESITGTVLAMSTRNGEPQSLAVLYGDLVSRVLRARTESMKTNSDSYVDERNLSETTELLETWEKDIDLRRSRNLLAQVEASTICDDIRKDLTACRLAMEHVEFTYNIRPEPASDG